MKTLNATLCDRLALWRDTCGMHQTLVLTIEPAGGGPGGLSWPVKALKKARWLSADRRRPPRSTSDTFYWLGSSHTFPQT